MLLSEWMNEWILRCPIYIGFHAAIGENLSLHLLITYLLAHSCIIVFTRMILQYEGQWCVKVCWLFLYLLIVFMYCSHRQNNLWNTINRINIFHDISLSEKYVTYYLFITVTTSTILESRSIAISDIFLTLFICFSLSSLVWFSCQSDSDTWESHFVFLLFLMCV